MDIAEIAPLIITAALRVFAIGATTAENIVKFTIIDTPELDEASKAGRLGIAFAADGARVQLTGDIDLVALAKQKLDATGCTTLPAVYAFIRRTGNQELAARYGIVLPSYVTA